VTAAVPPIDREALNSRSKKSGRKTAGLSRYFFETTDVPLAGFLLSLYLVSFLISWQLPAILF
jgi:hypothetical protein